MTYNVESRLQIRQMNAGEVELTAEWAGVEGWNPGLNDSHCFYAADPNGFFLAEVDGQPVGCISAVRYGDGFGFLGLYIVLPEHRGKGYGMTLWNVAMEHLSGRNIGLDGVVAQQNNYKQSGFKLAHRNVRYELVESGRDAAMGALENFQKTDLQFQSLQLLPATNLPFEKVLKYDTECFCADRSAFLKSWIDQPGAFSVAAMVDGQLRGYGVVRPCLSGCKVGPLFADSSLIAGQLFARLLEQCTAADGPVYLDVPETNLEAVQLALDCGMQPMFETARMYTMGDPGLPLNRIFGITSFELG